MSLLLEEPELAELVGHYAREADSAAVARWRCLFESDDPGPVVLVNRFAFRETAAYTDGRTASGREAFAAYASVSVPAMVRVGGRFLASAAPAAGIFGSVPETDLIVLGWYPDRVALLTLFRDSEYREAFAHRRAALSVDEVVAVNALAL